MFDGDARSAAMSGCVVDLIDPTMLRPQVRFRHYVATAVK
jgi:hypothetical protein